MRITLVFCFFVLLIAIGISPSDASEIHIHAGSSHAPSDLDASYFWDFEYRLPLNAHWSGGFTWLNEGHADFNHHRDGQAIQLWWHSLSTANKPIFEVGLGPYRYFDTVNLSNAHGHINDHGWGVIASAGVTWPIGNRWLSSIRINRVYAKDSISTTALIAGIGYRFGITPAASSHVEVTTPTFQSGRWEFDAMAGKTVENDLTSDDSLASAIGLRARTSKHVGWSLSFMHEGELKQGKRAGLALQGWLEDDLTNRVSVGLGLGPYMVTTKPDTTEGPNASTVSYLISVTAAYAIAPQWVGRLIWNRVGTNYNQDSDVVLLALGYRF